MSDLVEQLIAKPGLHTGPQTDPTAHDGAGSSMSRIMVTPLPGHLIYSWSYGRPGEPLVVRDVGNVRVST